MGYNSKKAFIFLFFVSLCIPLSLHAEIVEIIPKAYLILPEDSLIKVNWIIIPSKDEYFNTTQSDNLQLCVDSKNKPIIAFSGKILMNLLTGSVIKMNRPFKKMVCTEDGVMFFTDNENLYYGEIEKSAKGVFPEASLKPFIKLPGGTFDVYIEENGSFFAVVNYDGAKKTEIYTYNSKNKSFEKLGNFNERIKALSGNRKAIFIATDRQVWKYSDGKFKFYYEHPREDILELFYSEKTGLFYRTSNGVGLIKNGHAIEFLQVEAPIVFLKGNSLYVFFSKIFGLVELTNINDLNRYNFKIEKIIDVKKNF